jgi:hypothetical protein
LKHSIPQARPFEADRDTFGRVDPLDMRIKRCRNIERAHIPGSSASLGPLVGLKPNPKATDFKPVVVYFSVTLYATRKPVFKRNGSIKSRKFRQIKKMEVDDVVIKTCSGFRSFSIRKSMVGLFEECCIGNPGAFLVIVPKGINQLGSDERKHLYRISGGILAVERAQ